MTRFFRATTAALLGLLPACTGSIGDKTPDDDGSVADVELDPGPMDLRRLTNAEVRNSVFDVLGVEPEGLPDEIRADASPTGFHNASGPQTINLAAAERYYAAAEQAAEAALTEGTRLAALAGCDVEVDGAPCLVGLTEQLGRRLYRRPLASEETAALIALSASDATPRDAAKTILISVLTSPHFLWKVEIGVPDESGYLTLTGLERASRLSFFLLSSGPDDELLSAAEAGELDSVEGVARETRRLLADPRAEATLRTFAREWLTGDRLDDWTRNATLFPQWDQALAVEMRTEVEDFALRHLTGGDTLAMFVATEWEIGPGLASVYGLPAAGMTDFSSVGHRGGLLSSAGFLTASNRFDWTSPIHRGVFVRKQIFCAPVALPPDPVQPIEPLPGEDPVDAETAHTKEEPCASCHKLIDPIGHGLERYDAIGQLRDAYASGKPVRQDGEIAGIPDLTTTTFTDAKELGTLAYQSESVASCVARQALRFALGRVETGADIAVIEDAVSEMQAGDGSFEELVVAVTTSKSFLTRRKSQ